MKWLLLVFLISVPLICTSQETYTDSLAFNSYITGSIGNGADPYWLTVDTFPECCYIGDYWSWAEMHYYVSYVYLSFERLMLPIGHHIQSAILRLDICHMMGNYSQGTYPIFDTPNGSYNPPCIIEHVDYGASLDPGDLNPTILGLQDTLLTYCQSGWIEYDVKQWLLEDVNNNKLHSQYRLKLDPVSDYDTDDDFICVHTAFPPENMTYNPYITCVIAPGPDDNDDPVVDSHEVYLSNYPNPFNPSTTISYSLKENAKVALDIYNIRGQLVKSLESRFVQKGMHSVVWDGKDNTGNSCASGVYFYRLNTADKSVTKKMLMLK